MCLIKTEIELSLLIVCAPCPITVFQTLRSALLNNFSVVLTDGSAVGSLLWCFRTASPINQAAIRFCDASLYPMSRISVRVCTPRDFRSLPTQEAACHLQGREWAWKSSRRCLEFVSFHREAVHVHFSSSLSLSSAGWMVVGLPVGWPPNLK